MSESLANTRQMHAMATSASFGQLNEAQQNALAAQIVGAFSAMPVVGHNIVTLAKARDWDGLVGALGAYIDTMEAYASTEALVVNKKGIGMTVEQLHDSTLEVLHDFASYITANYSTIADAVTCAPCMSFALTLSHTMDGSSIPTVKLEVEHLAKVREEQLL